MSPSRNYVITLEHRNNAKRLRAIWEKRKRELDWNQTDFANALQIRQPTLSNYLNCVVPLGTDMIFKMAAVLKVNPAEIAPSLDNVSALFTYSKADVVDREVPILGSLSGDKTVQVKTVPVDQTLINRETSLAGFVVDTHRYRDTIGYPKGTTLLVDLFDTALQPTRNMIFALAGRPGYLLVRIEKVNKTTVLVHDYADMQQHSIQQKDILLQYQVKMAITS